MCIGSRTLEFRVRGFISALHGGLRNWRLALLGLRVEGLRVQGPGFKGFGLRGLGLGVM